MDGWWEFVWGGLAGVFGETLMHPVDTLKTRLQSGGPIGLSVQRQGNIGQVFKAVWALDGLQGFYKGVVPGLTGSFVTGATYFGFIEGSKDWIEQHNPKLAGPWAHFIAGATGDTIGSVIYVPCEVIKQRMQIQGSKKAFMSAAKLNKIPSREPYYTGLFSAGKCIIQQEGVRGLYAGYMSTLARDVPFAGFQIMFYEAFRKAVEHAHVKWSQPGEVICKREFNSFEELVLGGVAGGISAFICTPLDVVKTRLQVQGTNVRYKGWLDAFQTIWREEKLAGLFRGSVPRVMWYVPAAGLTFMTVELLRKKFNDVPGGLVEIQQRELPGKVPAASLDLAALAGPVPSYDEQIRGVANPVQES
ncbi:unnamed protein product [Calypogeia fissa]